MPLFEWDDDTESWTYLDENDDDAADNTNSRIQRTPDNGKTYGFNLTTYDLNTSGDFTFTLDAGDSSQQNAQGLSQPNSSGAVPFERRQ